MKSLLKPYADVLRSKNLGVSRWNLLETLALLAIRKRVSSHKPVSARLGRWKITAPDYDTLSFLLKEKFAEQEYVFQAATQDPVIVDCGAHIGVSLLYFKTLYPLSTVHCFEPAHEMFAFLQKNVEWNNLMNVHLYRKAVYSNNTAAMLYLSKQGKNINYSLLDSNNNVATETVDVIRLSQFLKPFEKVDLLKIDIEGSEPEVIRDLHQEGLLSAGKIKLLIVEFHQSMFANSNKLDDTISMLKQNNYRLEVRPHFSDYLVRAKLET